ncbi:hypothetical protein RHCRD62_70186 [Rhodococcus sp. RD6.2]|nr:hypothetical protein RHCRD62_70186 [Rhodococcus sp. RD6.2]
MPEPVRRCGPRYLGDGYGSHEPGRTGHARRRHRRPARRRHPHRLRVLRGNRLPLGGRGVRRVEAAGGELLPRAARGDAGQLPGHALRDHRLQPGSGCGRRPRE